MATTKKKSGGRKKAASTQAGEEVRKEMREYKKGRLASPEQAIAIGLSKARRAGKEVPAPAPGTTSEATRKKAQQDIRAGRKKAAAKKAVTAKRKSTGTKKSSAKKSAIRKKRATKKS